jgi:hypothetical protein
MENAVEKAGHPSTDPRRATPPASTPPASPEDILAQIPAGVPPSEWALRLEPVLVALVGHDAIRTDTVLDSIMERFGVRRRALLERMKSLRSCVESRLSGESAQAAEDDYEGVGNASAARPARDEIPQIQVNDRHLGDLLDEIIVVLVHANERRIATAIAGPFEAAYAPLFRYDGTIVRLEEPEHGAAGGRMPRLVPLGRTGMRDVLLREVRWVRTTKHGIQPARPVGLLISLLITRLPQSLPRVDIVTSTPVFGHDGTLLLAPGLYREERLWLAANPMLSIGPVPERPTAEQIERARALYIDELFARFPLVGPSDRAHALGAVLVPFVRRMIFGCTPLHMFDNTVAGGGSSMLCDVIAAIATGEQCSCIELPESEKRFEKLLTAHRISDRTIVVLDAAKRGYKLAPNALSTILTGSMWSGRVAGTLRMTTVPNRALWMMTSSQLQMSTLLGRRTVRIRLDPKLQQAGPRTRLHDSTSRLYGWVHDHRGELIQAALVLVRAWIAVGRPTPTPRLGSFEGWSHVIGGILSVAGVEGFLADRGEY